MRDLVERVAEAIYQSDGYDPEVSPPWPDEACDPHTYRRNARAALTAVAEHLEGAPASHIQTLGMKQAVAILTKAVRSKR